MLENDNVKDEVIENHEATERFQDSFGPATDEPEHETTINIKSTLLNLPKTIRNEEIQLISFQNKVSEFQENIEKQEVLVKADVSMEISEDGKKKFKNEIERSAEVSKRLSESETFEITKREYAGSVKLLKIKEINLKYLYNEFSALKAIARMNSDDNTF